MIQQIATKIKDIGGRCFYVGGTVRDNLLHLASKDKDIECFHLTIEQLEAILSEFGTVLTVGKSFGILKVASFPMYDFALPRRENKTGVKHTDFEVNLDANMPYIEAARRRDFTCNALMQDVLTGEILDFFSGIQAIQTKKLIHIDDATFIEDPLRGLRAAQFAARLDFTIAPQTVQLISTFDYNHLSYERIISEMTKGFTSPNVPVFIDTLIHLNIAKALFPELLALTPATKQLQQQMYEKITKTNAPVPIANYLITAFYLKEPQDFLIKITNDKADRKQTLQLIKLIRQVKQCQNDIAMRSLKQQSQQLLALFTFMLQLMATIDNTLLPKALPKIDIFLSHFEQSISNNPTTTPLVQGRDLILLGYLPTANFKLMLDTALSLEVSGMKKKEILTALQVAFPQK